MRSLGLTFVVMLASAVAVVPQGARRMDALVAAVRPALPYPAAAPDGATPAEGGAGVRWFVVGPQDPGDTVISVKANPLHPDTQKAGATADVAIQQAVLQAERKAQAEYERALAEIKRTGKLSADAAGISLDDEAAAGERIDAELELTIDLENETRAFEIASSEAPVIAPGTTGMTWLLTIPPNTYREPSGADTREHFRPAEARLYFGTLPRPSIARRDNRPRFAVNVTTAPNAFTVVLRGNETLLQSLLTTVDWRGVAAASP
jgi:hypothetical protein